MSKLLSFGIERTLIRLPNFLRVAWVSEEARCIWEPRLRRISNALFSLQWESVSRGIRSGCKVVLPSPEHVSHYSTRWASAGLKYEIIEHLAPAAFHGAAHSEEAASSRHVLVALEKCNPSNSSAFIDVIRIGNQSEELLHLGAPKCCVDKFLTMWKNDRFIDFSWPTAVQTCGADFVGNHVSIHRPSMLNTFWKWLGIRLLFTNPCNFDCAESLKMAMAYEKLGIELGYGQEMEWANRLLTWPVKWSALHGIAEIHTPILKLITVTDFTRHRYSISVQGTDYPSEGPRGLQFPYKNMKQ